MLRFLEKFTGKKNLEARLQQVIDNYILIADQDPIALRKLIPSKEIWRFVVDGQIQKNGRSLIKNNTFSQARNFSLFSSSTINYSIKEYLEKSESNRALLDVLSMNFFNLNEEQKAELTLADLLYLDKGWFPYEMAEPGSLKALCQAFHDVFNCSKELNCTLIKELHKKAAQNVTGMLYDDTQESTSSSDFRTHQTGGFGLQSNCSQEGMLEFLEKMSDDAFVDNIYFSLNYGGSSGLNINKEFIALVNRFATDPTLDVKDLSLFTKFCDGQNEFIMKRTLLDSQQLITDLIKCQSKEQQAQLLFSMIKKGSWVQLISEQNESDVVNYLENSINTYIAAYNTALADANSPSKKLDAIIGLVKSCEQLHPFTDGNTRTFSILLLNHLLLRNGFPLAIIDDPNQFALYSIPELREEIIKGMERTFTLLKEKKLYLVDTDETIDYFSRKSSLLSSLQYFISIVEHEEDIRKKQGYYYPTTNNT